MRLPKDMQVNLIESDAEMTNKVKTRIDSTFDTYYIKLGQGGMWEEKCLSEGYALLGFDQTPEEFLGDKPDWDKVFEFWLDRRSGNSREATKDKNEIAHFYNQGEDTIWITFSKRHLWWCLLENKIERQEDGTHKRECLDGFLWSNKDLDGNLLGFDRVSGKILKTKGYQRTIRNMSEVNRRLIDLINGEESNELIQAKGAKKSFVSSVEKLVNDLHEYDFEILIDLIFRELGLKRSSVIGKTEKDIDLDLYWPLDGSKTAVQIKSSISQAALSSEIQNLSRWSDYSRIYYVVNDGSQIKSPDSEKVVFWTSKEVADKIIDLGLTDWVFRKSA